MSLWLVLFQLFWRLPKRSPARPKAERLGRSAGSRQNNFRTPDLALRQTLLRHPVVALFPWVAWCRWRAAVWDHYLVWFSHLRPPRPLRNFLPAHLLPSIPDLQPAVLPLAYRYLTLGWRPLISLPAHLQKSTSPFLPRPACWSKTLDFLTPPRPLGGRSSARPPAAQEVFGKRPETPFARHRRCLGYT